MASKSKQTKAAPEESYDVFRRNLLLSAANELNPSSLVPVNVETLYYRDPLKNSDKVYKVEIVEEGNGFKVNYSYGKRNAVFSKGSKTPSPVDYVKALSLFHTLVNSKKNEGYTENESGKPFSKPGQR